ncbi:MAG TPA: hypothetical protein VGF38_00845 [Ktedonobacterales bacterium]|jgi:hypothetical protein
MISLKETLAQLSPTKVEIIRHAAVTRASQQPTLGAITLAMGREQAAVTPVTDTSDGYIYNCDCYYCSFCV